MQTAGSGGRRRWLRQGIGSLVHRCHAPSQAVDGAVETASAADGGGPAARLPAGAAGALSRAKCDQWLVSPIIAVRRFDDGDPACNFAFYQRAKRLLSPLCLVRKIASKVVTKPFTHRFVVEWRVKRIGEPVKHCFRRPFCSE